MVTSQAGKRTVKVDLPMSAVQSVCHADWTVKDWLQHLATSAHRGRKAAVQSGVCLMRGWSGI